MDKLTEEPYLTRMAATLYEPINVYKPLDADVGIVDGPFEYFTVGGVEMPMPFSTRMTVVRLANGDLFLHSPIAFNDSLADELLAMGDIRYLISPNQWHYAHIGEWQRAFPNATAWASPRVRRRAIARGINVHFDDDLRPEPPEAWQGQIDQTLVPSGIFKEFVFFHRASATLILADTIMNFELAKIDEPWRTASKLSGMYHPHGQLFFGMRLPLLFQRKAAKAAFNRIKSWNPRRIVLSHGRCFEVETNALMERLFGD